FQDAFEICGSIQFGSASQPGALVDLQFANNYSQIVPKIDTKMEDFESHDYTSALYPSDALALRSTAAAAGLNFFPPTATLAAPNAWGIAAGTYVDQLTLQQPQYARTNAVNTSDVVTRIVPFTALTHTVLAMDRDMIFGEDMYINMMVAPSYKIGYNTAASNGSGAATAFVAAKQPTLSGMYVNLAVEVDPITEASVRAKFDRGDMKFIFPYQYAWRLSTAGAGQISVSQQLNSGYGRYLKRIIQVPFDSTEASTAAVGHAYDHQNCGQDKITQYQTSLNSVPLQDQQVSCANLDDWRLNKDFLKGSVIRGALPYLQNWFHMDSFSAPKRGSEVPYENVVEGLDLSLPVTWSFTATAGKALTHYTFAEFIREIETKPGQPIEIKSV
ncbi:MAG: hypothetical protein P4L69_03375, partial [Desulfosporosinus sp.]|nr:hypothetical protein [Desulfosporosinus sp.]